MTGGRVVKVSNGDTITVLVNKTQIRGRLDGIDAPESKQAFGKRSSQSLADLCAAKNAQVVDRGKDRYGRTIGRVTCAGIDANSEQVRRGMAWTFSRYVAPNSPLYELEAYARLRNSDYGPTRSRSRRGSGELLLRELSDESRKFSLSVAGYDCQTAASKGPAGLNSPRVSMVSVQLFDGGRL